MKEELTTLMHSEFFDDPQERVEILVMGAAVRIQKGGSKNEILSKYGITEQQYDETFKRIFPHGLPKDIK